MNRPGAINAAGAGNSGSAGNRMRIRVFPTVMDEAFVDQILTMLKNAIREIQRKNNGGLSFEELYRNAYTLVLHKHGERLYNTLRDVVRDHLQQHVRMRVAAVDGRFLETLNEAWNEHSVAMVMIRDIFMYMDRVYVEPNRVDCVEDLGVTIFRDEIVRQNRVSENLREILLKLISEERSGVTVNWHGIKHACQMLIALGLHSREVYEADFERPFLKQTAEHYKKRSQEFLMQNSASVYVKMVEECIRDETDRARRYLDSETEAKILNVLDDVLIKSHMHTIVDMENSGLVAMITADRVEDLGNLYKLLRRVKDGVDVMTNSMSRYLRSVGERLVDEIETDDQKTPVQFIQSLLELKSRFDHFLRDAFCNDTSVKQRIQADFEYFFNKNRRSPEFLSLFMDDKLKKGVRNLSDSELESLLDKAMVLFRFLQEKDAFEKYYKSHVAKRLLFDKSVSDDAEKHMVSRLRTECGCQFTAKLEGMFKDKELWGTLNSNFKTYTDAHPVQLDINVRVLTQGMWPTQQVAPQCVIPDVCQQSYKTFEEFYMQSHSGRKIALNTMLGTAEVKAVFYGARASNDEASQQESDAGPSSSKALAPRRGDQKFLLVPTYMMVILMRFNVRTKFTFEELLADTQIPERELKRSLQSLAMGKAAQRILCRGGRGKEIEANDEFWVNDAFQSKYTRVKIQMITSKVDAEPERKEVQEKIEEDRKHEVEAAIVRIMKARKKLQHNLLISEVTQQLGHRFKPNPQQIKQRIESLIERDYLARDKADHKTYDYVA